MGHYLPLFYFVLFALAIALIPLFFNYIFVPKSINSSKLKPYECGFDSLEKSRFQFDIRFYLVAILFIIFDLEMVFMYPWAILVKDSLSKDGFLAMLIFLLILAAGFCYEWRKGALEWE